MEDLGDCTYFLGMRLVRDRIKKTISLHQDKYLEAMLTEYGMEDCRTISTPMIPNTHLVPASEDEKIEFEESARTTEGRWDFSITSCFALGLTWLL